MAGKFAPNEKFSELIGNRTCVFRACSIESQPTTLPRVPGRRVNFERNRQKASVRCCFLTWLTHQLWTRSQRILLKKRWTSNWPDGIISQIVVLFKVNIINFYSVEWRELIRNWICRLFGQAKLFFRAGIKWIDIFHCATLKLSAVGPLKRYFSQLRCERLRKEISAMENSTKQILPSTHFSHPVAVLRSCHVWFPVYLTKLYSPLLFRVSGSK